MRSRRLPFAFVASATCGALALALAFAPAGCVAEAETEEPALEAGASDSSSRPFEAGPEPVVGPTVECAIGSAIETERNDTAATATPFTELSICGVLETAKDVDYLTFTTPPGTKLTLFQAVIDGRVDFELSLAGATFGPAETGKFGSGTYLVKAFTTSGKPASYRIRVQFE